MISPKHELRSQTSLGRPWPSKVRWQLRVEPGGSEQAARPSATSVDAGPWESLAALLLRGLDLVGAGVGLVLVSPLLLALAILVKLSSPGPIFLGQDRVGLDRRERSGSIREARPPRSAGRRREDHGGRIFRSWRLRTIAADPESTAQVWASHGDPRITGVGHVLRKYRLDELPLLMNVLMGDLSLLDLGSAPGGASGGLVARYAPAGIQQATVDSRTWAFSGSARRPAPADRLTASAEGPIDQRNSRSRFKDLGVVDRSHPTAMGKRNSA